MISGWARQDSKAKRRRTSAAGIAGGLLITLTACGGSGSSSGSTSAAVPSLSSLRSCLEKAGYKNLSSANPGQVTVSLQGGGSVTLTVEASPQKAKAELVKANRGAQAFFGSSAPKNAVTGSVLLGGISAVPPADLAKIKSCAAQV